MTEDPPGRGRRPTRESLADRRARRSAIEDPAVVLEAALRFLEPRARAIAEVRRRLTGAGYRVDLIDGAIDRLVELGMLDDETFARHWVESRDRARPRGEHALRRELRLKGVDDATISAVLEERSVPDGSMAPDADRAAAQRLIERHARALASVADPRARRQRAYALLARNGFDPSIAAEFARRVGDDADAADPGPAADP